MSSVPPKSPNIKQMPTLFAFSGGNSQKYAKTKRPKRGRLRFFEKAT